MTITASTTQASQPTEEQTISPKRAMIFLRATDLRLYAYKSEGRFICRIVDNNENTASVSSRSTLAEAVTVAIGNVPV